MTREETLRTAEKMVCGHRESDYGSPEDSFTDISKLWTAYKDVEFTAHDVAMMMALLKIARIKRGNAVEDSYVDGAGYIACGAEIATNKGSKPEGTNKTPAWFAEAVDFYHSEAGTVLFADKRFAEAAANKIHAFLGAHGQMSLAEMYKLLEVPINGFDNKDILNRVGWNVVTRPIVRLESHWTLEMPRPVAL